VLGVEARKGLHSGIFLLSQAEPVDRPLASGAAGGRDERPAFLLSRDRGDVMSATAQSRLRELSVSKSVSHPPHIDNHALVV
jgi:hypothetical protein